MVLLYFTIPLVSVNLSDTLPNHPAGIGVVHKSVTVVDTISTTVTFYLLPFWGCFWYETGNISNIFGHKQIVCPDLMRPWSEKTGIGKIEIVIRI